MFGLDFVVDFLVSYSWFILAIITIAYILWDVNYFLRIIFTVGSALYFEDQIKPDQTTTIYGENFKVYYFYYFK